MKELIRGVDNPDFVLYKGDDFGGASSVHAAKAALLFTGKTREYPGLGDGRMDDTQSHWHPFHNIKVRNLFGWMILGFATFIMFLIILSLFESGPLPVYITFIFMLTFWPLYWIIKNFRLNNMTLHDIMGDAPRPKQWLVSIGLVVSLYALSGSMRYLFGYIASFMHPRLLRIMMMSESSAYSRDGSSRSATQFVLSLVLIVAIAPFIEEIIFRGIVLHRWSYKWGLRSGIIFSSLFFGLLHGVNFIPTAIFGYVAAIVYIKTRSLWTAIIMHVLFNGVSMALITMARIFSLPIRIPSIEEYRVGIFFHGPILIVMIPLTVYLVAKYWPQNDWRMPFDPEPPNPPSLAPECYQLALPAPQERPPDTFN